MGTLQLMFVFLSYILFSYFVMTSNQRTEMMLIQDAKYEMFDDMITIGDLANEYYFKQDTTRSYDGFQTPGYLLNRPYSDVIVQIVSDTLIHFTGTTRFEEGVTYIRQCTPSNSMALIP